MPHSWAQVRMQAAMVRNGWKRRCKGPLHDPVITVAALYFEFDKAQRANCLTTEDLSLQMFSIVKVAHDQTQPGARFSKGPETFRAHKAIFNSSVSKNGEVHTPETSCIKRTSVHLRICK